MFPSSKCYFQVNNHVSKLIQMFPSWWSGFLINFVSKLIFNGLVVQYSRFGPVGWSGFGPKNLLTGAKYQSAYVLMTISSYSDVFQVQSSYSKSAWKFIIALHWHSIIQKSKNSTPSQPVVHLGCSYHLERILICASLIEKHLLMGSSQK